MQVIKNVLLQIVGMLIFTTLVGCGSMETVIIGSALGLAGDKGIDYFETGEVSRIFYHDVSEIDDLVEISFLKLSCRLQKCQRFADGSLKFIGVAAGKRKVKLEVEVRPLAEGISSVVVTARNDMFLPEQSSCLLMMREILYHVRALQQDERKNIELML